MAVEEVSDASLRASLIAEPADSSNWDQIGQASIREQEVSGAARYFARANAATSETSSVLMRLAMAQELNGELSSAAENYIKCSISFGDDAAKLALYRAVGCFQKLGAHGRIVELAEGKPVDGWHSYQGVHEAIGVAYLSERRSLSALMWLCSAPVDKDSDQGYRSVLDQALAMADGSTVEYADICQLLANTSSTLFKSSFRARKLLLWVSRVVQATDIERLIFECGLVERSGGDCLELVIQLVSQLVGKSAAVKWAKMSQVIDPGNGRSFFYILPEEADLPEDDVLADWMVMWAKAAVVSSRTDPQGVNSAAIILKTGEDTADHLSYLVAAADKYPDSHIIQYNVGAHFNILAQAEIAEPMLKRALLVKPDYAKALSNFSVSHCIMLHDKEAIAAARRALAANPKLTSAFTNLAMAYRGAGDLPAAIAVAQEVLKSDPSDVMARMGLAFNQLAIGAIEHGFENYLSRWGQKNFPSEKRPFPQREWKRHKLAAKEKVVIYMEQGMGDELMFSWFLHYMERLYPGNILVECDNRLIGLFARSFPSIEFYPKTNPPRERLLAPDVGYKVPIGHLPYYFTADLRELIRERWSIATEPVVEGYGWLRTDSEKVSSWRAFFQDLGGDQRLVVGVAWRSSHLARARRAQYVEPEELVASIPDGALAVNLQYVYDSEEIERIERCAAERGIDFITVPGVDLKDDLDEVMCLCDAVDALATPLTSTAFMGGVIGKPTFVFRSSAAGSIWQQLGTPHIPWLPSIRLMFRDARDSWEEPIAAVREHLVEVERRKIGSRR
ncbi:tetratricopeptide repeat protein [Nisaea acidiphila]|uniref:Tetratricopeptide repeat protein n=1 Tax=Nisaea acidiphila TaxID=1862145 RepID=A0A9J7AMK3_9PROT|nr:tetratricopeptide repeat protein [Nisaea acidiphila]UUX48390.1 tetratricopeptide repeat protein [Nisaea acidiphila]